VIHRMANTRKGQFKDVAIPSEALLACRRTIDDREGGGRDWR
jgi:hypothetical protein